MGPIGGDGLREVPESLLEESAWYRKCGQGGLAFAQAMIVPEPERCEATAERRNGFHRCLPNGFFRTDSDGLQPQSDCLHVKNVKWGRCVCLELIEVMSISFPQIRDVVDVSLCVTMCRFPGCLIC